MPTSQGNSDIRTIARRTIDIPTLIWFSRNRDETNKEMTMMLVCYLSLVPLLGGVCDVSVASGRPMVPTTARTVVSLLAQFHN